MAVQVVCPQCQARLRLAQTPAEGQEVGCPRCGSSFSWPGEENEGEPSAGRRGRPAGGAAGSSTAAATAKKQKKPRKIKLKKRKSNPAILIAAVGGGLVFVGVVAGLLFWFFSRKSVAQEMIAYLPAACDEVNGVYIGHLSRYPKFFETCEQVMSNYGFRRAMEAFAKVTGQKASEVVDYVVQGYGKQGGRTLEATVLRTKVEFDPGLLAKLPGAKKYTADGVDYYTINDPGLNYPGIRVFAPTNRLVVFARGDMGEDIFRAMLTGNKSNPGRTPFERGGRLAQLTVRGTVWRFVLYDSGVIPRMQPPPKREGGVIGGSNDEDDLKREIAEILSSAKGYGIKASVGSRDVRGEWLVMYSDSDKAYQVRDKWRNAGWVRDDEQSPPRWWKALANKSGGGNTAPNVLKDNLSFRASGEVFIVRSAMEVKLLQNGIGSLVGNFTAGEGGSGFRPPMMPGGPPGGAVPPGGSGGPGGRRRRWSDHRGAGRPCCYTQT
ncbi:MAG: zinc-ribbon domain-containing protein [Gemmataceae bacterium]|nr:zinc-ribbon domain-containing protein [Gemmataceae bacterium]